MRAGDAKSAGVAADLNVERLGLTQLLCRLRGAHCHLGNSMSAVAKPSACFLPDAGVTGIGDRYVRYVTWYASRTVDKTASKPANGVLHLCADGHVL